MINVNTITIAQFKTQFPEGIGGYPYLPVWSATQTYNINDIVFSNGQFYQAIAINTNQTPPNPTYWASYTANQYSYISDMDITTAFLLVAGPQGLFPSDIFCGDSDALIIYAYLLLAAHIILFYIKPQQFAYQGQAPATIGVVNNQHAGNVGFGTLIPESITSSILYSTLNTTPYGQQYMVLIDLRSGFRMFYSFGGIRN